MKRSTWLVAEVDVKPNGACRYCGEPLGGEHKADCVCRQRTIIADFTFRVIRKVPEDWDESMINFHMNDSSWCLNNVIAELQAIIDNMDEKNYCLCGVATGRYVREATSEDEELYQTFIGKSDE